MIPEPHSAAGEARLQLLHALGLAHADPVLDALAAELAAEAGVPYAMINIFNPATGRQEFVGLATPSVGAHPPLERSMAPDWGFCPEVASRTKALVLPNVFAKPRFAVNKVVEELGISTYAGAPLIYAPEGAEGQVIGTGCFVGQEVLEQSTGQASLALIKKFVERVSQLTYERAGIRLS